ncbi:caspase family protein [Bradyrhizobium cenepequi]
MGQLRDCRTAGPVRAFLTAFVGCLQAAMLMRVVGSFLIWLAVTVAVASQAHSANRVALVIGNGAYRHVAALPNPLNDADDVSLSLKRLDFEVTTVRNASFDEMRRSLIDFGRSARGAEFAIIFFAGHGMEINGENWLIPVDAQLASDVDVRGEAIGLQFLMDNVSSSTKLGLVILDACRDNPFLQRMRRTNIKRTTERGFARIEPSDNVLVAYAARDGTTAIDSTEGSRNSPFTRALINNIETSGLEIQFLFRKIRDEVMHATGRQQQPFHYGSLGGDQIFLKPPPVLVNADPKPPALLRAPANPALQSAAPTPQRELKYKVVGVASNDVLHVRSDGDHSRIIGRLSYNERNIRVLARSGDWWEVQAGETNGWVAGRYLQPDQNSVSHQQFGGFAFQYTNEVASTVSNINECVDRCRLAPNCLAYTFFTSRKLCRLMTRNDAIRVPNTDAISGLVQ